MLIIARVSQRSDGKLTGRMSEEEWRRLVRGLAEVVARSGARSDRRHFDEEVRACRRAGYAAVADDALHYLAERANAIMDAEASQAARAARESLTPRTTGGA
jgi:hypothetical protein